MKVAHLLACGLESGAGRAVKALQRAALARGVDSTIVGRLEKDLNADLHVDRLPTHDRLITSFFGRAQKRINEARFAEPLNFGFLQPGSSFRLSKAFREADIIHIQWANAVSMGTRFWTMIARENRPIVWTLRDMWPLTGGCHFSGQCRRFESECGSCPQLSAEDEHYTTQQLRYKNRVLPPHTTFIAISDHFARQVRGSKILEGKDLRVIPNSAGIEDFSPIDVSEARNVLGLSETAFVLSAGAVNLASARKGAEAIERLLARHRNRDDIEFALFGGSTEKLRGVDVPNTRQLGQISETAKLNDVYSASDIFLMPSLQESFGKTTLEAMASGTPVIAFHDTPAEEMIKHEETGWLVPHGDFGAYVEAVDAALLVGKERLAKMGQAASDFARSHFSMDRILDQHLELYAEKLAERQPAILRAH